jgi:hypothetical protein
MAVIGLLTAICGLFIGIGVLLITLAYHTKTPLNGILGMGIIVGVIAGLIIFIGTSISSTDETRGKLHE